MQQQAVQTSPVYICVGARLNYDAENPGSISNVVIENITARDVDLPSAIIGCTSPDDITIENFNVIPREDTTLPLDNVQDVFDRFFVYNVSWT